MILPTAFKTFRTNEFIQFFTDVVKLCIQNRPQKLQIQVQLEAFEKSNNNLETVFKHNQKSDISSVLTKLDQRREEALMCIRKTSDGYLNHYKLTKRNTAQLVVDCIEKYGENLYGISYQADTSIINKLGNELKTIPKLSGAIEVLGITDVVDEMIDANILFNKKCHHRKEETTLEIIKNSETLVKDAIKAYKVLTSQIVLRATTSTSNDYSRLLYQLNSLINRYNNTMALRGNSMPENDTDYEVLN